MTNLNLKLGSPALINEKIYYLSGFQVNSGDKDHISINFTPMHPAEWLDNGTNEVLNELWSDDMRIQAIPPPAF